MRRDKKEVRAELPGQPKGMASTHAAAFGQLILGQNNAVALLRITGHCQRAPSQGWVIQLFHAGVEIVAVTMQNGSWDHPIRFLS